MESEKKSVDPSQGDLVTKDGLRRTLDFCLAAAADQFLRIGRCIDSLPPAGSDGSISHVDRNILMLNSSAQLLLTSVGNCKRLLNQIDVRSLRFAAAGGGGGGGGQGILVQRMESKQSLAVGNDDADAKMWNDFK